MRRLRQIRLGQKGQAIILTLLAVSIFLLGALGLAIDASHLYSQRQMAQVAADAAATAAMMSVYGVKNTAAMLNEFGAVDLTCSTTSNLTPCLFARQNGFGAPGGTDIVDVKFLDFVPGVPLSDDCTPMAARVTVTRVVGSTLMQLLGTSNATIRAQGTAACVAVDSPVPILVLHPTKPESFRRGGSGSIQICGGPAKSIQVNSTSSSAVDVDGGGIVDLSKAGPADSGLCTTGTGSAFGTWGGPSTYPTGTCGSSCGNGLWIGTTGRYGYPESWMNDPLRDLFPGGIPSPGVVDPAPIPVANGVDDCPASPPDPCYRYLPGRYNGGIEVKNRYGIFTPGLYWMNGGGFHGASNSTMVMCTSAFCAADADTGMGMVVYNTGNDSKDIFDVGSNGSANLLGPPAGLPYKSVIFFQDRASDPHKDVSGAHKLGGGGDISIKGTIYLTNTRATMAPPPEGLGEDWHYQELVLRGNSGSTTSIEGQIIVDVLDAGGGGTITMKINPDNMEKITQVALVR